MISGDVQRLQHDVCWAIEQGLGPRDLIPMLERLERCAAPGSDAHLFARAQLAEVLVEHSPWRAALLCRSVLSVAETHRAWGVLGLAHTMLGNYRSAVRAYRRALQLCPDDPSAAHNLGHLLDVVFERPDQALPLLAAAHRALPADAEIAGSYGHALLRCGRRSSAKKLLTSALGSQREAERLLDRWAPGDDEERGAEHALA